jgi:hypothetical protein
MIVRTLQTIAESHRLLHEDRHARDRESP